MELTRQTHAELKYCDTDKMQGLQDYEAKREQVLARKRPYQKDNMFIKEWQGGQAQQQW